MSGVRPVLATDQAPTAALARITGVTTRDG